MPFKEFCRLIIELDPNTNKSSLKNSFQDLLEGALNTYFEDQHKENINTSVKIAVRRIFRDEMKNFIRKIKSINLETK
ncbi:hypothetical protein [Spiroplasma apis]|uniref:Uncharacterized protein n=1 Tax=Spiroplasma apis B31 TaxID=1276258 RepID=V5RIV3_SPIAP|nr:hypothetical protein [Spiroplasma apis]AHB36622.1 hypothetical protein SAPIS_v1c07770 [Spiroplasma apis B31]